MQTASTVDTHTHTYIKTIFHINHLHFHSKHYKNNNERELSHSSSNNKKYLQRKKYKKNFQ